MSDRLNFRILEIDFTTDNSDNDIADVDAITYYRSAQSRTAGNGFSVTDFQLSDGEGGTKQSTGGTDLASNEVWIWMPEQLPGFNVIVMDQATQA
jgi:hypothetical protein